MGQNYVLLKLNWQIDSVQLTSYLQGHYSGTLKFCMSVKGRVASLSMMSNQIESNKNNKGGEDLGFSSNPDCRMKSPLCLVLLLLCPLNEIEMPFFSPVYKLEILS